jgi:hypothetical protein
MQAERLASSEFGIYRNGQFQYPLCAMEITDELLIALIARLIKMEATVFTFANMSVSKMGDGSDSSQQAHSEVYSEMQANYVRNQLESFSIQFPQFEKILRDHVLVSNSDLKSIFPENED